MSTSTLTKLMVASATIATLVSYANAAEATPVEKIPADPVVPVATDPSPPPVVTVATDPSPPPVVTVATDPSPPPVVPVVPVNGVSQLEMCTYQTQDREWRTTTAETREMNRCITNPGRDNNKAQFMIAQCTGENQVTFLHFEKMEDGECKMPVNENLKATAFQSGASIHSEWLFAAKRDLKVFVNCKEECVAPSVMKATALVDPKEDNKPAAPLTIHTAPTGERAPTGKVASASKTAPTNKTPVAPTAPTTPITPPAPTDKTASTDDNSGVNSKSAMGVLFAGLLVFLGMNA